MVGVPGLMILVVSFGGAGEKGVANVLRRQGILT